MTDPRRQVIDVLSRSKRVLVTTHVRPDGDALGTAAAMVLGMRKAGIPAEVLLLSHLPRKYAFVFTQDDIAHTDVEAGWPNEEGSGFGVLGSGEGEPGHPSLNPEPRTLNPPVNPYFERFDTLLVVDTGTWGQLPGLRERIEGWKVPKLVVDHHLTQQDWADVKLVVPEAAAAGEIAADLLDAWPVSIDSSIASALFLAIASDTGWFQFSNTRPQTLRLAARLMEAGGDFNRLYKLLYQSERAERIALQARVMQSLQLHFHGVVALATLRRRDFEETNTTPLDTENLINIPLQIGTVQIVALCVERPDEGTTRISLRSKGGLNVAAFANRFGGGGHERAAAFTAAMPLDAASSTLLNDLAAFVPRFEAQD